MLATGAACLAGAVVLQPLRARFAFIILDFVHIPGLEGGHVDWAVALIIAVGSTIGGQLGATVGRRLPPNVLRAVIVLVGVVAVITFVF